MVTTGKSKHRALEAAGHHIHRPEAEKEKCMLLLHSFPPFMRSRAPGHYSRGLPILLVHQDNPPEARRLTLTSQTDTNRTPGTARKGTQGLAGDRQVFCS